MLFIACGNIIKPHSFNAVIYFEFPSGFALSINWFVR